MKLNENEHITASPRGGVGSNVIRSLSTIRYEHDSASMSDEPASHWRSLNKGQILENLECLVHGDIRDGILVVGDSRQIMGSTR